METEMIQTAEDFGVFARKILTLLPKGEKAIVVTLEGDLGAGKTTFTQALAKELGVTEHVVSPTFMIMRMYKTTHEYFKKLVHIDAYRIEDESEVDVLCIPDLFKEKDSLVCIEWPERIPQALPTDVFHIKIEIAPDNTRTVTYGTKS